MNLEDETEIEVKVIEADNSIKLREIVISFVFTVFLGLCSYGMIDYILNIKFDYIDIAYSVIVIIAFTFYSYLTISSAIRFIKNKTINR